MRLFQVRRNLKPVARGQVMKSYTLVLFIAILFGGSLLVGCAGNTQQVKKERGVIVATPSHPNTIGPKQSVEIPEQASLFQETAYPGFFQDIRAFKVGDLVTINIVETSKAEKKAETDTQRDSSIYAGINNFLGYEQKMGELFPQGFNNNIMFKGSMKNSFKGTGNTKRDESMTATITARVMEVLPNGNLFIRGTREIRVNNETQFIVLSGLVRPYDISKDNTVLSTYIADAKIEYTGKGALSDKQRPGWLMRILDYVWPF
ncbi:MAG: hypothetical protein DRH12_04390 [Deltaproteobacteria bacterium]|nr:MAG: hypothetical protein DRH12_04390 [Deltaproteobacteria bacterium]